MSAKAEKNIKTQERVNYYKMLGVSASATEKDIKDSYHKLAKKFHPDKQKGGASTDDVTVDFTKIAEAYHTLSDPAERKKYDIINTENPVYSERPDAVFDKPTKISVLLHLLGWQVKNIDGYETLVMNLKISLYWQDHRLVNFGKKKVPKDIWKPELFSGTLKINKDQVDSVPTFKDPKEQDGWLQYDLPFLPLEVNLDNDYHRLKNFPYDSVRLDGFLCCSNEQRLENDKDIILVLEHKDRTGKPMNIFCDIYHKKGEYMLNGLSYGLGRHTSPNIKNQWYRDYFFSIHLQRNPTFFFWKAQVPTCAIVLVSLLSYAMEPGDLGDRMETVLAMFLTSFAIQWTVMERLPPTPYLHNVDHSLNAALGSMFLVATFHCISYRIHMVSPETAATFDIVALCIIVATCLMAQVLIYLRVRRLSRKYGGRTWKEGHDFWNNHMSVDPGSLYHRDFTIEELGEASITIGNNKHLRNVGRKVSPEEF
jgi:hypothetical protein